jgi:glycosyltransferase involved in cell wall biosynthesis
MVQLMSSIDVIVPCYNYGRYLDQCVDSVLQDQNLTTRVLIIDDASSDNTPKVASGLADQDSRVTYWRHQTNKGHIATYNEGIEWASADYMLVLSADDYVLPGALSKAAACMDKNPNIGFVFGPYLELFDDGRLTPSNYTKSLGSSLPWISISTYDYFRLNRPLCPVATCTAVVRTAMQKWIGGYRPELWHAGDMEMWLRFAAHGPVGRMTDYQGVYRLHAKSMSRPAWENVITDLKQRKEVFDLTFQSYGHLVPAADELKKYLLEGLAEFALWGLGPPFNRGDFAEFDELMEFALRVCPDIRKSYNWKLQKVKRILGPRVWSVLEPARRLVSSIGPGTKLP